VAETVRLPKFIFGFQLILQVEFLLDQAIAQKQRPLSHSMIIILYLLFTIVCVWWQKTKQICQLHDKKKWNERKHNKNKKARFSQRIFGTRNAFIEISHSFIKQ